MYEQGKRKIQSSEHHNDQSTSQAMTNLKQILEQITPIVPKTRKEIISKKIPRSKRFIEYKKRMNSTQIEVLNEVSDDNESISNGSNVSFVIFYNNSRRTKICTCNSWTFRFSVTVMELWI